MKIHDAFLFCLDAPYVYIVSEKYAREYNECMCFLVKITSIPSPCHAQWYMKPKGDDKFTPLDVNAEEYQGSTNSLPHPKLVVIEKDQLKKKLKLQTLLEAQLKTFQVRFPFWQQRILLAYRDTRYGHWHNTKNKYSF